MIGSESQPIRRFGGLLGLAFMAAGLLILGLCLVVGVNPGAGEKGRLRGASQDESAPMLRGSGEQPAAAQRRVSVAQQGQPDQLSVTDSGNRREADSSARQRSDRPDRREDGGRTRDLRRTAIVSAIGAINSKPTVAERRDSAVLTAKAVSVAVAPDEVALINASLTGFPERAAFAHGLSEAFPVIRFEDAESVSRAIADPRLREVFLRRFGERFAARDWISAAEWAANLPAGQTAVAGWDGVIAGWGEADPQALLEWAVENQLPDAAETASGKIARTLASADPQAAVQIATKLTPSAARTQALTHSLTLWAVRDHDAVIQWAAKQVDFGTKSLALIAAAKVWGRTDPKAASEWIASWDDPTLLALKPMALSQVGNVDRRIADSNGSQTNGTGPAPDNRDPTQGALGTSR